MLLGAVSGGKSGHTALSSVPKELSDINDLFNHFKDKEDSFNVEYEPYLTSSRLIHLLNKHVNNLAMIHFSGHTNDESIVLNDHVIHSDYLAEIFATWEHKPSLFFLNGCDNDEQVAPLLDAGLLSVIYTTSLINDALAANFSEEFYKSLFSNQGVTSLNNAFLRAKSSVKIISDETSRSFSLSSSSHHNNELKTGESWNIAVKCDKYQDWTLQQILTNSESNFDKEGVPENPYQGLSAFTEEESQFFFGRSEVVAEIHQEIIKKPRLFYLSGASGTGKTSIINAGLIPLLRQEEECLIIKFRPLEDPYSQLAACLSDIYYPDSVTKRLKQQVNLTVMLKNDDVELSQIIDDILRKTTKRHVYLLLDQFEELFTYSTAPTFIPTLLSLLASDALATVIISTRAGSSTHFYQHPHFASFLDSNPKKTLCQMSHSELREAIVQPAKMLQVSFEAGVVERLIKDLDHKSGQLPLLEFCLTQLWDKQKYFELSNESLTEIGGVSEAISNHAEQFYKSLNPVEKEKLRSILLLMVHLSDSAEATRQISDYLPENKVEKDLFHKLLKARIITSNINSYKHTQQYELVHEALIDKWPRMQRWIHESNDLIVFKGDINPDISKWKKHGNSRKAFLHGFRLSEAKLLIKKYRDEFSEVEINFIEKSINYNRQWKFLLYLTTFIFVVSLVLISYKGEKKEATMRKTAVVASKSMMNTLHKHLEPMAKLSEIVKANQDFMESYNMFNLGEVDKQSNNSILLLSTAFRRAAEALLLQREYTLGMKHINKSILLLERIKGLGINNDFKLNLVKTYTIKSQLYKARKLYTQAVEYQSKALEIIKKLSDKEIEGSKYKYNHFYSKSLSYLADVQSKESQSITVLQSSLKKIKQAIDIDRSIPKKNIEDYNRDYKYPKLSAYNLYRYAQVLGKLKRYDESLQFHRKSLAIREDLMDKWHHYVWIKIDSIASYYAIAKLYERQGSLATTRSYLEKCLLILRGLKEQGFLAKRYETWITTDEKYLNCINKKLDGESVSGFCFEKSKRLKLKQAVMSE